MFDPTQPKSSEPEQAVVVVGGGVGGLVAAAVLARAGVSVTVLEAQSYLGGCAGTFFRQRYRFDAGATLAAGFGPEGAMTRLFAWLGADVEAHLAEQIMSVRLPSRTSLVLPADRAAWRRLRRDRFGPGVEKFWAWQERTASTAWRFADQLPPWPANSAGEWLRCLSSAMSVAGREPASLIHPGILLDTRRSLAHHLPKGDEPALRDLRSFVDGQLLISAQAPSDEALALYGAAALDFPWRGVAQLRGGMGGIAEALSGVIQAHGGRVLTRRRVTKIVRERGRVIGVESDRGERLQARRVVANLTPWNLRALLDPDEGELPEALADLDSPERDLDRAWGAFVLHCGVDEAVIDDAAPLHHQVHLGGPMGDGNTVFVSVSPGWDGGRAPAGKRAVTLTTHTVLAPWWELLAEDREAYVFRKASYQDRLLAAGELAIPGLRRGLDVVFAGTPVTYSFYTGRMRGWVGGIPQTRLGDSFAPRISAGLRLVGDSVFPGQSTLAVALSSLRVASGLLAELGREAPGPELSSS